MALDNAKQLLEHMLTWIEIIFFVSSVRIRPLSAWSRTSWAKFDVRYLLRLIPATRVMHFRAKLYQSKRHTVIHAGNVEQGTITRRGPEWSRVSIHIAFYHQYFKDDKTDW